MRAIERIGLGLAIATALAAWPSASSAVQSEVAAGAKVYSENCGRCHNPRSPTERTDREWTVIVNHMRIRAGLTGQQARQVLAFLQETNGLPSLASLEAVPRAPAGVSVDGPADASRGRSLVEAKGCQGCHVIGSTGGSLGPSLNGVIGRRGADFVTKKLTNPAFDNPNTMMPSLGLSEAELSSIVEFLSTLEK